ncbi:MAG UNVERIFIED_CONTAM: hypothetical protein LVR18_48385 [Planctomycetaceae bacterium]|jgi:hypothetical protein
MLTSGLTEIIEHTSGYTVPAAGIEIEIGGYTAGNPAGGNNIDGFDQLQISGGNALLSGGPIDVKLVNDFVPAIGDRFNFLKISSGNSVTGTFTTSSGLFSFPDGDRWFDIVSDGDGGLSLEVRGFLSGLTINPPEVNRDAVGRLLGDYFNEPAVTFTGDISIAGLADVSGTFTLAQSGNETLAAGTSVSASLADASSGLTVSSATFGLAVAADGNYALEASGNASLTSLPDFTIAGSLALERNTGSTRVNRSITAGSQTVSIDVAAGARQFAGQSLTLTADNFASLTGNFAFDQQAGNLRATGTGLSGGITIGSVSAGVSNASFGLIATPSDLVAFEASGGLALTAAGLTNVAASSAALRHNTTNQTWTGTSISIGDSSYTFSNLPQASSLRLLSATGLTAQLGSFVSVNGDAAFRREGSELQAIVRNASASLSAGNAVISVTDAQAALVLDSAGRQQFHASGDLALTVPGVSSVSGTAHSSRNTSTSDVAARSITVDGLTVSMPALPASSQSFAADAQFNLNNLISVSGSVAAEVESRSLQLSDGSSVDARLLKLGGTEITGFAGLNGPASNPTAVGISLTGLEFGLVSAASLADSSRQWTAASATAAAIAAENIPDISLASSNLTLSTNQADSSGKLVNFAATPVVVATGPADSITLNTNSSEGSHTKAAGNISGSLAGFANVSGSWNISRSVVENVPRLAVGVTQLQAFVGNRAGETTEAGVRINNGVLGMVIVAGTPGQPARYALTASGQASAVNLPGLSLDRTLGLEIQRFDAAIDETIAVGSGSVRVKYDAASAVTRLAGPVTLGTPIADLSGEFAIETTGTSPDRRLLLAATGVTGFVGNTKGTLSTADDSGVGFTGGSLLAVVNSNGSYALDASGTAAIVGVSGLSLSGTLTGQKNTTGAEVSEDLTIGGVTRNLSLAKDVSKVEGSVTLAAENVLYLTGTVGVEKKTSTLTLLDGTTVQAAVVQIGGSSLSGFAGLNAAPGSSDQTGVSLSNASFGYSLATPTDSQSGTDLRTWSGTQSQHRRGVACWSGCGHRYSQQRHVPHEPRLAGLAMERPPQSRLTSKLRH